MHPVMDLNERGVVAQHVRQALARYQPRNYQINVNEEAILKEEDWYHVLVTTPNGERDRDFYDALAKAEGDLEENSSGTHYLLVPVLG